MNLYVLCASRITKPYEFQHDLRSYDRSEWFITYKDKKSNDDITPFTAACNIQTDIHVFQAIFDHVGDRKDDLWKQVVGRMEFTPLHYLCFRIAKNTISPSVIEYLLRDAGGKKYWLSKDTAEQTPLHYAVDPGYGNDSKITKQMLRVCLENDGYKALLIENADIDYAPIWGVILSKHIDWVEMMMRLGGALIMMKHKNPTAILEKLFDRHYLTKEYKKKVIETIQRELVAYHMRLVSNLPHSQGYMDGTDVQLQDLPKHLIEDKIISKLGGRSNRTVGSVARARRGTQIGRS